MVQTAAQAFVDRHLKEAYGVSLIKFDKFSALLQRKDPLKGQDVDSLVFRAAIEEVGRPKRTRI